jgi:hypothetical protein
LSGTASFANLIAAGPIQEIRRVGYEPLQGDDVIEIAFANGALFNIDIGHVGATGIEIYAGSCLERAYGHLRTQEPAAFTNIARDWTSAPIPLDWAIGQALSNPRRLYMTEPYRVEVGYAFACGQRTLALMGEADYLWASDLADPEIAGFGLVEAPL